MSKDSLAALGGQLLAVRNVAGLSQAELASLTNLTRPTIAQVEGGGGRLDSFLRISTTLEHEIGGRSLPPGVALGMRLSALRRRKGISVRALVNLAGVSAPTISGIEAGGFGHMAAVEQVASTLGAGLFLAPKGTASSYFRTAALSSSYDGWTTPKWLLDRLYPLVGGAFDLDPCSPTTGPHAPVRARTHYTREQDGLRLNGRPRPWPVDACFMNPPYGRDISLWMSHARQQVDDGIARLVIGLVPVRSDTGWWADTVAGHSDVLFLRGRLKFGDGKAAAPFASALVIWGAEREFIGHLLKAFPDAQFMPRSISDGRSLPYANLAVSSRFIETIEAKPPCAEVATTTIGRLISGDRCLV